MENTWNGTNWVPLTLEIKVARINAHYKQDARHLAYKHAVKNPYPWNKRTPQQKRDEKSALKAALKTALADVRKPQAQLDAEMKAEKARKQREARNARRRRTYAMDKVFAELKKTEAEQDEMDKAPLTVSEQYNLLWPEKETEDA